MLSNRFIMFGIYPAVIFSLLLVSVTGSEDICPPGISFLFKKQSAVLLHSMKSSKSLHSPSMFSNAQLDTLSNRFITSKQYIEIIRQDHPTLPGLGLAMGFEFDETNGEFPYTPAYAVMQLKDFGWGGVAFRRRDTSNFTGLSNAISEDIQIEVDGFRNDTIFGRFSGLLINGAGTMATIDSGRFCIKLYRVIKGD